MIVISTPSQIVIVVLGGGLDGGRIGFSSRLRAIAATVLYRHHGGIVIMSGGKTAGLHGPSEADVMKEYVTQSWRSRIPAQKVLVETASLSTPENVSNVVKILRKLGLENAIILLVAGRRNRLLAAEFFRAENFTVHPYTVRQALIGFRTFIVPKKFDPKLSPVDRRRNVLFHFLGYIDPKGHLAAWIGRRMRGN